MNVKVDGKIHGKLATISTISISIYLPVPNNIESLELQNHTYHGLVRACM